MKTKKCDLIAELARVMVNNWIANGDQPENKRAANEAYVRRMCRTGTIAQLQSLLVNITRL